MSDEFTKLVVENDPELWKIDDSKDKKKDDNTFCPLCAKYRDKREIVSVTFGPVFINICKKCNVVMHNLDIILARARKKMSENAKAELESKKILMSDGKLIVPGRS